MRGRQEAPDSSGTRPDEAGETSVHRTARAADGRPGQQEDPVILFLGTSLTAGYGLEGPGEAFPGLLGQRLTEAGASCRIVNAGVSGDTSAGGRARLSSLLASYGSSLALLFVELGANDGLRGLDPAALQDNLAWIIGETQRRHPRARIVIAGMRAPVNMGPSYTQAFQGVFEKIAQNHNVLLIPFLLEGVAMVESLNQSDGIHPNRQGHATIADYVWSLVESELTGQCASGEKG